MEFLLYFILQAHFLQIDKMGLIVQIINKYTILPKAPCLQICSKQASIHDHNDLQLYILHYILLLHLKYMCPTTTNK